MAESFLTPVIESLVHLLTNEVRSFNGVRKKVESLQKELEIIQCLLKDADARSDRGELSDSVKTWVKQLREEADRIEDVIDEYRHNVAQSNTDKHGFVGFLSKVGHRIKALKSRYPIASQICEINESLRRIKDTGQAYGLSQSLELQSSSCQTTYIEEHDPRLASLFIVEDDEYVDVPSIQEELKRSLIEGVSARTVTSMVGQGGIGKTTLVKKVYDEVKQNFDCSAWITVSRSYDVKKLLKIMMQEMCATAEYAGTSTGENNIIQGLVTPLRQYLQTKSYLVVFDDVWNADFWTVMKHALPGSNKCGRIIITTRNATIAAACKESPFDNIQRLETWSQNEAWKLFCKKTFRYEFESRCPTELEKLSHEIVSKCQGLPLTIATVAGILSRKRKVEFEWQRVLGNLDSEFKTNPELTRITKILSLSYHDLPYHLKSCLLYFGIFPEEYRISCDRLYELWIAEGIVKASGDKTLKDVAKEYLNELIERNLVLFEMYYGALPYCQVHDLLREFILSRANDSCFCRVLDEKNSKFGGKSRCLSIHGSMKSVSETIKEYSGVRSIFLFDFNDDQLISNMSFLVNLLQNFKLLRVLDFEGAHLDYLPEELGYVFHLRYLNLKRTNIKVIPKCIGKLHNLQTLNLMFTLVQMLPKSIGKLHNLRTLNLKLTLIRELPMEINKLRNLRHISSFCKDKTQRNSIHGTNLGVKIQEGFGYLEDLETLEYVEVYPSGLVSFIDDLEKLRKLKAFGVLKLTTETSRAICAITKKLNHLEHLYLATTNEDYILDVEPFSSSPPLLLQRLSLIGQLQKLPHWISELWNLQALFLSFSKLTEDPLKYLKHLPNLMSLRLRQSYDGEQLHFEEGGFQKLKDLTLLKLKRLKVVKMDRGTLPLLKILNVDSCTLMEEIPAGIQHLRNLKELTIREMPTEFVVRIQPNGGLDYLKIQHVPIVQAY
ncbi:NB-ARC domain, LRR domain containing protein [Trema orientale]|uniref:NB-ARC domain, LRR domain containing protein n=1 Tax=Trema orientale TaxID=63057 RepID=A0A2P5ESJ4_TREOI|nr:NB-ARC domain, LRR domain containing protein [Trema orientale]